MFKETAPGLIPDNAFKLIVKDWRLITAGFPESFNAMTGSWGGLGNTMPVKMTQEGLLN